MSTNYTGLNMMDDLLHARFPLISVTGNLGTAEYMVLVVTAINREVIGHI